MPIETGVDPALLVKAAYASAKEFLEQLDKLERQPTVDVCAIEQEINGRKFKTTRDKAEKAQLYLNLFDGIVDNILKMLPIKYRQIMQDHSNVSTILVNENNVISRIQLIEAAKEKLKLLSEYAKRSPECKRKIAAQCVQAVNSNLQMMNSDLSTFKENFPEITSAYYASLNEQKPVSSTQPTSSSDKTTSEPQGTEDSDDDVDNADDADLIAAQKMSLELQAESDKATSEPKDKEDSDEDEQEETEQARQLSLVGRAESPDGTRDKGLTDSKGLSPQPQRRNSNEFFHVKEASSVAAPVSGGIALQQPTVNTDQNNGNTHP
jgi:hypothetical protein